MQSTVHSGHAPIVLLFVPIGQTRPAGNSDEESSPTMRADDGVAAPAPEWTRLIAAIAARQDRAAFDALFQYFAPRVKTYMMRSGVSEARAEDLAQETMLTVWRKAPLFDPESHGASGWIFAIARNLRIDAFRRERRGGVSEVGEVEAEFQVDDAPLPDASLETAESETRLRSALERLPADQVRVIELSFFEEKAQAEIAGILRIPLGTVKSRLRLALKQTPQCVG